MENLDWSREDQAREVKRVKAKYQKEIVLENLGQGLSDRGNSKHDFLKLYFQNETIT